MKALLLLLALVSMHNAMAVSISCETVEYVDPSKNLVITAQVCVDLDVKDDQEPEVLNEEILSTRQWQ